MEVTGMQRFSEARVSFVDGDRLPEEFAQEGVLSFIGGKDGFIRLAFTSKECVIYPVWSIRRIKFTMKG